MHEKRTYKYHCTVCKNKLQKRGKTAANKQRWYCKICFKSSVKVRPDLSRAFVFEYFINWLLGKASQTELDQSARTFRNKTAWCWNVSLPHLLTGEVHHTVIIDGIRVGGMVCLIARTTSYVIAWHWVPYESSQYWIELLQTLPPPSYVVCDGQKGLLKAILLCWPATTIQRCRCHAWLNVKAKLTLHPKTPAGQELLRISHELLYVRTKRQARRWKRSLKYWHHKYHSFMNQRTIKPNPKPRQRKWHYTHARLRSAYRQLAKIEAELLRSSYRSSPNLCATTNYVEGGINSQLRTKLKLHRGMPAVHQRRLVDWYLYTRTENPKPPRFCL